MVRIFPPISPTLEHHNRCFQVNQTPTRTMRSTDSIRAHQEGLNDWCYLVPNLGDFGAPQYNTGRERYPAWGNERSIPLSKEEIISLDLQQKQWPDIYGLLSHSLASSVWAMPRYRGDINVLLVGDPGMSKSQTLQVSPLVLSIHFLF
jgi:MCM P-loop domain